MHTSELVALVGNYKTRRRSNNLQGSQKRTDNKENKIFLMHKEIQMGSGAKAYMRQGGNVQIFSLCMIRSLVIYDFAPDPSKFPNI